MKDSLTVGKRVKLIDKKKSRGGNYLILGRKLYHPKFLVNSPKYQ